MRLVDDGLGAFGVGDGVFDRPRVEVEFIGEILEDRVVGVVDVAPHQGVVGGEAVRYRRELEVILGLAFAPDPAADVGHPIIMSAPRPTPRIRCTDV